MISEILVIGDEIRCGALEDNYSAFIARKLEKEGIEVARHMTIGDDPAELIIILKEVSQRSDIAVVTGRLGSAVECLAVVPAANAAEVTTSLDTSALESLENFFRAHQHPLPSSNRKKAMLPSGAHCLNNSFGVISGFHLKIGQCEFFILPGVPFEVRRILQDQVIPRVIKLQGPPVGIRLVKTISTFGFTDVAMMDHMDGFNQLFPHIKLGLHPIYPEIHLILRTHGTDEGKVREQMNTAIQWICRKLRNKIISDAGESMTKVVGDLLRQQQAHLAVAESCTGGLIADLVTNVPGSSDYFVCSAVTYSNKAKMKILGVTARTLDRYGAVSEQTAKEMARGVRQISGATYGLSVSGIAGPGGATIDKPVGTVCIGVATADSIQSRRFNYTFRDRWMNKQIFAAKALDLLRRQLLGIPY